MGDDWQGMGWLGWGGRERGSGKVDFREVSVRKRTRRVVRSTSRDPLSMAPAAAIEEVVVSPERVEPNESSLSSTMLGSLLFES